MIFTFWVTAWNVSLQLVVQVRHLVPMRLSLDDQFFPLPSRRNPSFAVLLAQIKTHRVCPDCCPQSWYDNPASEPSLDGNIRCATVSCIFAQPGVNPNFLAVSCEILMFRGTGRSSTRKNGGSSRLRIGRGTSGRTSLNTF